MCLLTEPVYAGSFYLKWFFHPPPEMTQGWDADVIIKKKEIL